jgi:2-dehydropantoate 2-reductase
MRVKSFGLRVSPALKIKVRTFGMNILVMGAGAVGSVFGGFLAKTGHAVTLIGRGEHIAVVRESGLRINGIWGEHFVPTLQAIPESELSNASITADEFDVILICVKSFDTRLASERVRPFVAPDALLISLQNGLGNVEAISTGSEHRHVLGGRVIFGVVMEKPGTITVTVYTQPVMLGFPQFNRDEQGAVFQEKAQRFAAAVQASGIPCEITEEIEKFLWAKLIYNCALNPLSALHQVHYGALTEHPELKAQMDGIVRELFLVARAKAVKLFWETPEDFLRLFYAKLVPDTYFHRSSMLQDLERGRQTEIDNLCGIVVRYGLETKVATPLNALMVERIKGLTQRQGVGRERLG